ncbi:hypothetical protein Hypma_012617 [Hypsizygus marmoreus]|uniref:Uncharacterized protein n=1 Tax=Hypsizygus marmoreus TaxID=39966 RepID=A0A369JGK7_HYPMA|nr:hypothetical protein Hypma_012617 [Hypsizygus marmoreus]
MVRIDSPAKDAKGSPDSQTTSSSKQTSSDKLSALPTSTSNPNITRLLRSPNATSSSILPGRGHRRSLDASVSLPSFATADFDSPPMGNTWNTTQNLATHTGRNSFTRSTILRELFGEGHSETEGFIRERPRFSADQAEHPPGGSDPPVPSPALRSSAYRDSQKDHESSNLGSRSPSQSRSRAASPLRIFQQWSSRHRHRLPAEEPFVQ